MTEELKTLKDMQGGYADETPIEEKKIWVKKDELRIEAIKWGKELNKAHNREGWGEYGKHPEAYTVKINGIDFDDWHEATDIDGALTFIEHFFNITEEQLND